MNKIKIYKNVKYLFSTIKMMFVVSEQQTQYNMWKNAVQQSIGWNKDNEEDDDDFVGF